MGFHISLNKMRKGGASNNARDKSTIQITAAKSYRTDSACFDMHFGKKNNSEKSQYLRQS